MAEDRLSRSVDWIWQIVNFLGKVGPTDSHCCLMPDAPGCYDYNIEMGKPDAANWVRDSHGSHSTKPIEKNCSSKILMFLVEHQFPTPRELSGYQSLGICNGGGASPLKVKSLERKKSLSQRQKSPKNADLNLSVSAGVPYAILLLRILT